jgi:hypothetical protein
LYLRGGLDHLLYQMLFGIAHRDIHENLQELYSLLYTLALNILAELPLLPDKQQYSQGNPLRNSAMGQAPHLSHNFS